MKTYLITMIVLHMLAAAMSIHTKPGTVREPATAGVLLVRIVIYICFVIWGLNLLTEVAA